MLRNNFFDINLIFFQKKKSRLFHTYFHNLTLQIALHPQAYFFKYMKKKLPQKRYVMNYSRESLSQPDETKILKKYFQSLEGLARLASLQHFTRFPPKEERGEGRGLRDLVGLAGQRVVSHRNSYNAFSHQPSNNRTKEVEIETSFVGQRKLMRRTLKRLRLTLKKAALNSEYTGVKSHANGQ